MTAANTKIADFHYGETIQFTFAAKDRDGSIITTPDLQTLTVKIAESEGGAAVLSFDTTPQIVLTDAANGVWLVSLEFSDYSAALSEGSIYHYQVNSTLAGADPIVQAHGLLTPNPSI